MACSNCGSLDFYLGVLGPDCANANCKFYKNGKINDVGGELPQQLSLDFRGFVVMREGRPTPCEEYVVATNADAERWKDLNGLFNGKIVEVRSDKSFRWQPSRGTVRGIILADRLFAIYEDGPRARRGNWAVIYEPPNDDVED